ncbi:hypothetical protein H5410_057974 [Solanum commersonii]|uniref:Calcineurin-like phosphoesterase domain-containing protein n=1 Tax=Solanum commersonii TaxID=4109 RepID=A0A9J5WS83_SOLCO|nr:hypothetical protein H5410_057974 [Solanum commersonii]
MEISSSTKLFLIFIFLSSFQLCKASGEVINPFTKLRFDGKNGEFRILQVADMHYGDGKTTPCKNVLPQQMSSCSDLNTTDFIFRMIHAEKPHLIVFTGDNIFGFDATDPVKSMDAAFAPAISSNIPWAAVLGNHDQQSTLSREGVMKHIVGMKSTLSQLNPPDVPDIDGFGNYNLEVHGIEGSELTNKSVLNLYFLDSGDYSTVPSIPGYGWIKPSQLFWFQRTSRKLKRTYMLNSNAMKAPAPGLAYFHIPLREYASFDSSNFTGVRQEGISSASINSGFFTTMVEAGDVKAAFAGHDHLNDFCGKLMDINLCYAGGFGYHAYGKTGWSRRARMVVASLEKTGKGGWGDVESIKTWKRLDDEHLTTIDTQVLWSKRSAGKVPRISFQLCKAFGGVVNSLAKLRFDGKTGEFRILQVADMHYGDGKTTPCEDVLPQQMSSCSDLNTTDYIFRMIHAEKPHLIVFTGDNIFGSDATDPVKSMEAAFAPAISSIIPWAAVLGNHDQESTLSREGVMKHIVGMKSTLSQLNPPDVPDIDGFGNYNLEVHGIEGSELTNKSVLNLYFLDSGDYSTVPSIPGYGWIKPSQQFWFQRTSRKLKKTYMHNSNAMKAPAPGLAYFHIPLPEYASFDSSNFTGVRQEGISSASINSGFFTTMVEAGDVKAAFAGHDHINDFCGKLMDINLCYAGGFGYHAYGKAGWSRRARMVVASLEKTGKGGWGDVKSIKTWKRLDDEHLTTIDTQVLWSKRSAGARRKKPIGHH